MPIQSRVSSLMSTGPFYQLFSLGDVREHSEGESRCVNVAIILDECALSGDFARHYPFRM